ncbi:MAG TPA: lysylphosphatidylglycerol synthase transmembrane domain-containing protein, partial [Candidatus Polarisedimenticolia bacterium]|nr:lysylphosphatidylglycerol synthase transmembrane domain-containing protein [Candidatus Polarisedimenticolia bacterium]
MNHASDPRPAAPGRGSSWIKIAVTLAVTALALGFLWRVVADVGPARLASRLAGAHPGWLAAAVALTVGRFLLQALRWEILVRREAPIGLRGIAPILMAGNFLALVTPALRIAGPILRAYYLSKETGRPRARFYGTIVADQTANFTIYAVAAAAGTAFV